MKLFLQGIGYLVMINLLFAIKPKEVCDSAIIHVLSICISITQKRCGLLALNLSSAIIFLL